MLASHTKHKSAGSTQIKTKWWLPVWTVAISFPAQSTCGRQPTEKCALDGDWLTWWRSSASVTNSPMLALHTKHKASSDHFEVLAKKFLEQKWRIFCRLGEWFVHFAWIKYLPFWRNFWICYTEHPSLEANSRTLWLRFSMWLSGRKLMSARSLGPRKAHALVQEITPPGGDVPRRRTTAHSRPVPKYAVSHAQWTTPRARPQAATCVQPRAARPLAPAGRDDVLRRRRWNLPTVRSITAPGLGTIQVSGVLGQTGILLDSWQPCQKWSQAMTLALNYCVSQGGVSDSCVDGAHTRTSFNE